ncbi:phospholipid-binding lipoprotein MlaA [Formivibrio citricus]|uniref:Phospholipid-binding lipoprotein MlaA n=1 Tax=Formivibrio citricus TaxID=83765 RepID=A0A1I5DCF5_9NEIS|nr:VacJ family lipoprotein [Formivibrio citricus]SFN96816.1 phospholipid-binding lipoprotein MlaA [Formivibrio citricus]
MRRLIACLFALALAGCATPSNNYDPLESINRPLYTLNKGIDKVALRPLAQTWTTVTPEPVQKGVHNFFENIYDLFAIPAAALQGKFEDAGNGLGRVLLNTTVGLAGLFDVATELEIPKSDEDFGQTLGYWGVPSGPYLMLPGLGPKTVRDSVDSAIYFAAGPTTYLNPESARYVFIGVNAMDKRAQLLPFDKTLAEQYDEYAFVRDTYLQRRWFKVHDGNPPYPLPMGNDDPDGKDPAPAAPKKEQGSQPVKPADPAKPSVKARAEQP